MTKATQHSEGVVTERPLPAPVWVGPAAEWPGGDPSRDGPACALLYRSGEVEIVSPRDHRAMAETLTDAAGTAVVLSAYLLPRPRTPERASAAGSNTAPEDAWQTGGRYLLPPDTRHSWSELLARLEAELRLPAPDSSGAVEALLKLLVIDAARLTRTAPVGPPIQLVVEAAAVIDARYREPLSLRDVATALSISPSHLSRLVRRATGLSVVGWIRARRMEEARRLLRGSDASVESIATEIGYRDLAHFRRDFQRAHNTAPARWRERARPDFAKRAR